MALLVDNIAEDKPKLAKENYESIFKAIGENEKNKATFLEEKRLSKTQHTKPNGNLTTLSDER